MRDLKIAVSECFRSIHGGGVLSVIVRCGSSVILAPRLGDVGGVHVQVEELSTGCIAGTNGVVGNHMSPLVSV